MTDLGKVRKYGYTVPISRQMAIDTGIIEPTPEERTQAERDRAEHLAAVEAAKPQHEAAIRTIRLLSASDDKWSLAARLLHQHANHGGVCDEHGGEDYTTWPCDVVQTIAAHYGAPFPDPWLR
jgi:hypothetical protein